MLESFHFERRCSCGKILSGVVTDEFTQLGLDFLKAYIEWWMRKHSGPGHNLLKAEVKAEEGGER